MILAKKDEAIFNGFILIEIQFYPRFPVFLTAYFKT